MLVGYLTLGGCASGPPKHSFTQIALDPSVISEPEINYVRTVKTGDYIARRGRSAVRPAMRILKKWVFFEGAGFIGETYVAAGAEDVGLYLLEIDDTRLYECFKLPTESVGPNQFTEMYACDVGGPTFRTHIQLLFPEVEGAEFTADYQIFEKESDAHPSFFKEFVYDGRKDDDVRFIYREIHGDKDMPGFSQHVTFNIARGESVQFKSLKIEIIDATAQQLTYRLVSNFAE